MLSGGEDNYDVFWPLLQIILIIEKELKIILKISWNKKNKNTGEKAKKKNGYS
jgi:hypothetical protein